LKDDNNENADDIPLDTDYGVDIDTELPNHLAESSGNRNEVLQISTVNSEGVKIGNDYNADGSEGIDDFEDVSVDTTIDFQKSLLNSKEVERKVSVAKSMTKTVGNNGNHQVS